MTTTIQRSGSRGEISPKFYPRADLAPWHSAFKTQRNYYTSKEGVPESRGGLQFIGELKNPAATGVLKDFRFSSTQQYILEFTNELLRFFYQGQYLSDSTIQVALVPNETPLIVVTNLGGDLWQVGDSVYITGVKGPMAQFINNRLFIISSWEPGVGTPVFIHGELGLNYPDGTPVDSTNWGVSTDLSGAVINHVYQISTPYLTADLPTLKFAQTGGTMKIRHINYPRQVLSFIPPATFTLGLDNAWPSQIPASAFLKSTAGNAGAINYSYKVSALNLLTGEESFPGSAYGGSGASTPYAISSVGINPDGTTLTINTPDTSTLATNDLVTFNQNLYGSFTNGSPRTPNWINPGTQYAIVVIDGTHFSIQSSYNYLAYGGSIASQGIVNAHPSNAYLLTNPTSQTVSAISTGAAGTNPAKVTTAAAHNLVSGDEVILQNTGIFGLDNNIFTVTKVSNTVVSLNGVNGLNYSAWPGISGTICATAFNVACDAPTIANPNVLTWGTNPAQGDPSVFPIEFLIYLSVEGGPYGFIGTSGTDTFSDTGIEPTEAQTPLQYTPLFMGAGNYPGGAAFYDQRDVDFATGNNPQFLAASVVDFPNNFTEHDPLQDNDAVTGTIATDQLTQIWDAVDMGYLVLMTDVGPIMLLGDPNTGSLTPLPGGINAKKQAYMGAGQLPGALLAGKNILYFLKDGATVHSLKVLQTLWGSYIGDYDDVSLLSFHLLSGYTVPRWAYQEFPHKIFWMVRSDGNFLSLTYEGKEQAPIVGWGRHDTLNGYVESVACAQEGAETAVYFIVRRVIKGETKRYVERLALHDVPYLAGTGIPDVRYYNFLDSSQTYDGTEWAGAAANFTLTNNGGDWSDEDDAITAAADSAILTASMIGQALQFPGTLDANGNPMVFTITSFISAAVVGVSASADVPVPIQGIPIGGSVLAIQTVYGLWNLEGQAVSVLADGFEAANALTDPNPLIVTNGSITLDQPYGVITVGLPIVADLGTLPFDDAQQTQVGKKKLTNKVNLGIVNTRGLYIGPSFPTGSDPVAGMTPLQLRAVEEGYYEPTDLATGFVQEVVQGAWSFNGLVCIRQISPVPATITSIAPFWVE